MKPQERNPFLEGSDSEDEIDRGYDSEDVEAKVKGASHRGIKRRRTESFSDHDSREELDFERDANEPQEKQSFSVTKDESSELESPAIDANLFKRTSTRKVEAAQKAAKKSGVVYLSRVPPFMKPQTLRHFLTPHAPQGLGRIFLTPEDQAAHTRRVRSGGNKKKSYTDGWVEFTSKSDAKIVAESLNGNIIGGKKGNFYHDDLWNIKYLRGFKWSHLTEQIANENAERAARLREEIRKTRQENRAFVQDVERGKMLETMDRKIQARSASGQSIDADTSPLGIASGRTFRQKKVRLDGTGVATGKGLERITRLGSMII